jgi:hypothetical protein
MGGLGSGRPEIWPSLWSLYSVRTKHIREACDFRPGLVGHITFGDGTTINVRTSPGYVHVNDVPILIDWTTPNLGGRRAWFLCCCCRRRCTVVYGRERQWGCRRCWRANYPSQKEGRFDRLIRRAGKLRRRLGDTVCEVPMDHVDWAGIPPGKPKGMHWRTYSRLARQLEHFETEAARLFHVQTAQLLGRLERKGQRLP